MGPAGRHGLCYPAAGCRARTQEAVKVKRKVLPMYSRREFGKLAVASVPVSMFAAPIESVVSGVRLGCITYGWRDLPRVEGAANQVDAWVKAVTDAGLGECEIMNNVIEPAAFSPFVGGAPGGAAGSARGGPRAGGGPPAAMTPEEKQIQQEKREKLRQWRMTTPMRFFADVRRKFSTAGIRLHAYTCNRMADDYTEAEIDRHFEQAKALGVEFITSSTQLTVAKKLVPFAEKHKFKVAFHGHAQVEDPNEFATYETYEKAFDMSKYYWANPDIGHMTAANLDPIPFIQKHHARIALLHLKDRLKNQGPYRPWGQGDAPIREVLQLIKKNKYPIPCYLEFQYPVPEGSTTLAEWKKCIEYMKAALA
jgi:sugar phosphate isomerase/epimerase